MTIDIKELIPGGVHRIGRQPVFLPPLIGAGFVCSLIPRLAPWAEFYSPLRGWRGYEAKFLRSTSVFDHARDLRGLFQHGRYGTVFFFGQADRVLHRLARHFTTDPIRQLDLCVNGRISLGTLP